MQKCEYSAYWPRVLTRLATAGDDKSVLIFLGREYSLKKNIGPIFAIPTSSTFSAIAKEERSYARSMSVNREKFTTVLAGGSKTWHLHYFLHIVLVPL